MWSRKQKAKNNYYKQKREGGVGKGRRRRGEGRGERKETQYLRQYSISLQNEQKRKRPIDR